MVNVISVLTFCNRNCCDLNGTHRKEWTLNDFEIGKPLGEGKFGHVYLARTKKTKFITALKVIHSKQIEAEQMESQINRETDIHIGLK